VRIVIADCSAIYSGRGDTKLPRGERAIIIKGDGSVSIHNDVSNKPLNYMKTPGFVEHRDAEEQLTWTFDARHESLTITLYSITQDIAVPLIEDDPGLERDGTEHQLQKWLVEHPEALGGNFQVLGREVQTSAGPVDLLLLDALKRPVAVEVKRVAMLGAVDQVRRYAEALVADGQKLFPEVDFMQTVPLVAALDIRPKTEQLAAKRGVRTVVLPHYWRDSIVLDPTGDITNPPLS
jgi:RecB family endonuclease NucS